MAKTPYFEPHLISFHYVTKICPTSMKMNEQSLPGTLYEDLCFLGDLYALVNIFCNVIHITSYP